MYRADKYDNNRLNVENAVINVADKTSTFYKVVIETPANFLNRWVIAR